ncbi:vWA domain-containing protein [Slackia exigua]|uniref:vWA domain-containing protein n=1 Tax=Slackia exigua TaxID=84109 RepID=UPI00210ED8F3|nr:vWA domain-containing protein [Slackia exigua]MCQ5092308.1 VWA domain-containing protein [Slackia exigua]
MDSFRRRHGLHAIEAAVALLFAMLATLALTTGSAWAAGASMSKTATELTDDNRTKITLSIPSEEEQLDTMVVFVLDKSSFSDTKDKALEMLDALKARADATGANIKVGVIEFNRTAHPSEVLDLTTQYDQVKDLFTKQTSGGTNMHAGLLAAKEMLAGNADISDNRKYMVLVSDGSTYLYCPDGDYTKCSSRAYAPTEVMGGYAIGGYYDTAYYQPSLAEHGNIPVPTTTDAASWEAYLNDVAARDAASNGAQYDFAWKYYDEDWPHNLDLAKQTYISMVEKIAEQYPDPAGADKPAYEAALAKTASNTDMSRLYCNRVYQELAAKYNTFAVGAPTLNPDGANDVKFVQYLNGGASASFDQIENEILYAVGAGSRIDDYMGVDFDFVNDPDSMQVKVGDETLAAEKTAENEYGFGKIASGYRYLLSYVPGEDEHFTFTMNEPVTNFARVQLVYEEKLVNVPTEPGDYTFETNAKAVLHPMDSAGTMGPDREFEKPTVNLTVKAVKPGPDPTPTPDPEQKPTPATKTPVASSVKGGALPKTGDTLPVGILGLIAVGSAAAIGTAVRYRRSSER